MVFSALYQMTMQTQAQLTGPDVETLCLWG